MDRTPSLGAELDATVRTISPEVDVASRMLVVEAELAVSAEWRGRLPAGLAVRVREQAGR